MIAIRRASISVFISISLLAASVTNAVAVPYLQGFNKLGLPYGNFKTQATQSDDFPNGYPIEIMSGMPVGPYINTGDPVRINTMANNSKQLIADGHGVPYLSSDLGEHWSFLAPYIFGAYVDKVYQFGPNIYLVTGTTMFIDPFRVVSHVFKTIDGGKNWTDITQQLGEGSFGQQWKTIDANMYLTASDKGIFKTVDGGENWDNISPKLSANDDSFTDTVFLDANTYLAGTKKGWLYKTQDGGENWNIINPDNKAMDGYISIIDASSVADTYLITVNYVGQSLIDRDIYVLKNGGKQWLKASIKAKDTDPYSYILDDSTYIVSLQYEKNGASTYGTFKTTDGGQSWNIMTSQFGDINGIEVVNPSTYLTLIGNNPSQPTKYYLYKTIDGGQNWNATSLTLDKNFNAGMLIIDDNTYIVGGYKTIDGGKTWSTFKNISNSYINQIAIAKSNPNVYLAVINKYQSFPFNPKSTPALMATTNVGQDWNKIDAGLNFNEDTKVSAIAALDSKTYFVGTRNQGLYKTLDGGQTWQNIISAGIGAPATSILPLDATTYLVGTNQGTIYKTVDGGTKWMTSYSTPIPVPADVKLVQTQNNTIFALLKQAILKSTDKGATWGDYINLNDVPEPNSLAVIDDNIYLVGAANGVYKTLDGGKTWLLINNGLPSGVPLENLVAVNATTYAVVTYQKYGEPIEKIYITTDGGQHWSASNVPGDRYVPSQQSYTSPLCINDNALLIGTNGYGILKVDLGSKKK